MGVSRATIMLTRPLHTLKHMAQFRIAVSEEQSGFVTIEAETKDQAESIALEKLNNDGIVGFDDFDVGHREVLILNS